MPEFRPLRVYVRPDVRYSLVRGPVRDLTTGSDIVPNWSAMDRAWLVRTDRIGDLLALAELDGGFVVRVRTLEVGT